VPCFNVTAGEFEPAGSTPSASVPTSTASGQTTASVASGGLSTGAKAGIAIGSILTATIVFALAFLAVRHKRNGVRDDETITAPVEKVTGTDKASVMSGKTAS
jgi:hypothetical protein